MDTAGQTGSSEKTYRTFQINERTKGCIDNSKMAELER